MPPRPVKIGHKKDGDRMQPHRFHVSCHPSPHPAAGSATVASLMVHLLMSRKKSWLLNGAKVGLKSVYL